ncbi:hypothetical protein MAR_015185 [Mya arenaria]|uniref:Uncharacterized protein n=1 Tax=Mya arenaria TaxID=6604 RepID=A0ABY7FJW8_MYAAR|nr:hypothetical protein MAR_015185 [Mya arenaria]
MALLTHFQSCDCVIISALGLSVPDYESMWIPMRSGDSEQARVTVKHGLGETPLLVDVQVKAMHAPNKDFIFTGIGGRPRDDDESEPFGGVIYYYNNEKIVASAPIKNSKLGRDGFAIYTASELYVTTAHGLDAYPALVLVRAKLIDGQMPGYMADSVGASFVSYPDDNPDNEYFIHAFNDRNIRVWVSDTGLLAGGSDGYEIFPHCSSGMLEMYAWAASSLQPAITAAMDLGPEVVDEQLEIPLTSGHVEAVDGPNVGYRFPGSGAMAYSATVLDPVCTYGGLTYAYTQEAVRFWRPTDVINGGLVCVASVFDTFQWADPEERCIRIQPARR